MQDSTPFRFRSIHDARDNIAAVRRLFIERDPRGQDIPRVQVDKLADDRRSPYIERQAVVFRGRISAFDRV